ncbi:MAG: sulfonate ABC transporter [Desulfurococcales archaeon]|nr:sulfonate ABC transporter [Desulfurococcales archaeon]
MVRCPVCGLEARIPEDAMPGELIEHDCGTLLEVVEDNGVLQLRVFEGDMEDWGE